MARFDKNSLDIAFGIDTPTLVDEVIYTQRLFYNMQLTDATPAANPIDLTGALIVAQLIRRTLLTLDDSRNGFNFTLQPIAPVAAAFNLTIDARQDTLGRFRLNLDDSMWGIVAADPLLAINADLPPAFSGDIKITFPADSANPVTDVYYNLFFIVRGSGVQA